MRRHPGKFVDAVRVRHVKFVVVDGEIAMAVFDEFAIALRVVFRHGANEQAPP